MKIRRHALKLISLAAACLLWLYVGGQRGLFDEVASAIGLSTSVEQVVTGVSVRFLTYGQRVDSEVSSVRLRLRVPKGSRAIDEADVRVVGEIPQGAKGEWEMDLKVTLPKGAKLLEVTPRRMKVQIH